MIIQVDSEGQKAVEALCDVALKIGGLQNMKGVQQVLMAVKPFEKPQLPPPPAPAILEDEDKGKGKGKGKGGKS